MISKNPIYDLKRFGISWGYIKNRKINPSILVNSIPKSGTHLIENLLVQDSCYRRIVMPTINDSNFQHYNKEFRSGLSKKNVFILAHLTFDFSLSDEQLYIVNFRDPRDNILSYYDHFKRFEPKLFKELSDKYPDKEHVLKRMTEGLNEYGFLSIKDRYISYINQVKRKKDNVIMTKFEDLISNPESLGKSLESFGVNILTKRTDEGPTVNKGIRNRYKEELSEEFIGYINSYMKEELAFLGY